VFQTAGNQRTVENYAKAFRQILSEIFGLPAGKQKYDYRQGGLSKWLGKVHATILAEVTPTRVHECKRWFLTKAGGDPLGQRRARISVNSLLRQACSLFAAKRIRHLQLSLPNPSTFDGVDFESRRSMKYHSEINAAESIKTAKADLRDSSPEADKVFLLAIGAGLRKKEIDLLEWSSFRWDENVVRIEATRYFHPKSEDSIADVLLIVKSCDFFRPTMRWRGHPL
jgi:hypothetical protein